MLKKSFKNILADSFGFTLIELLVSISIIGMMSGLFMVNYHSTNKRSELGIIKQKLASNIRLAQNYCLGSKTYGDDNITPSGGWGVHFDVGDQTRYIIFADKKELVHSDGNQTYDEGEAIEIKTLPAGLTIDFLSIDGISANEVDIVFFPPDPITYINGAGDKTAEIVLKENINNSTAEVTVNFFGLIDTN